jgi:hypothetical protein
MRVTVRAHINRRGIGKQGYFVVSRPRWREVARFIEEVGEFLEKEKKLRVFIGG